MMVAGLRIALLARWEARRLGLEATGLGVPPHTCYGGDRQGHQEVRVGGAGVWAVTVRKENCHELIAF